MNTFRYEWQCQYFNSDGMTGSLRILDTFATLTDAQECIADICTKHYEYHCGLDGLSKVAYSNDLDFGYIHSIVDTTPAYQQIFDDCQQLVSHYRNACIAHDDASFNLKLFGNGHRFTEVSSEVWGILRRDMYDTMAVCDNIGSRLLQEVRHLEEDDRDTFWNLVVDYTILLEV